MASDKEIATVEKSIKRTGRGGSHNFPSTAEPNEPGENARYLRYALVALDLPPIDISDIKQCEARAKEYFSFCVEHDRKPNIVGLCNWLGISRDTFHSWRVGECRSDSHSDFMKKCVSIMEDINLDYFQNGKINPAAGIFILKNHFGYRDVTDLTIEPRQGITDQDAETVAAKYAELPPD